VASYRVGDDDFTLNVIEHGLLRRNAKPPYSLRRTLGSSDRRLLAAPSKLDPRIHFALNCAASSCPPIRAYEPDRIDEQLALATRTYIAAETETDHDARTVKLPYLLKLYAKDFGADRGDAVRFVADRLPAADADWIRMEHLAGTLKIGWTTYDWTIAT